MTGMARRSKQKKQPGNDKKEENLWEGAALFNNHSIFRWVYFSAQIRDSSVLGKKACAVVDRKNGMMLNRDIFLEPQQWFYVRAHGYLHMAFHHFDKNKMPGYNILTADGKTERKVRCDIRLWNIACDIYIAKFLSDTKIGKPISELSFASFPPSVLKDEEAIYHYLTETGFDRNNNLYGTGSPNGMDMIGLDHPIDYENKTCGYRDHAKEFSRAIAEGVAYEVEDASGRERDRVRRNTPVMRAAGWFLNHYPLLGALASSFQIIEDYKTCQRLEVQIAAVNPEKGEIYANPAAGLDEDEWRFVLAHEYLHAGLEHGERCLGRDPFLWNIAVDYVVNGWLEEMKIGKMPKDVLYDSSLKDESAESIYDKIITDIRRYTGLKTFRGYGKGDIFRKSPGTFGNQKKGMDLDRFYREALASGLAYHEKRGRGFLPAGLTEEIRALLTPPVPWNVQLAEWFDIHFSPLEKKRSYARPSRRQSTTPDIPRPRNVSAERTGYTFGVIVDTSGSMNTHDIGIALGAIISYSVAKEVEMVRLIYCDAKPYDAGYVSPEELAGRVEVKGRGGTVLQPAVDLLESSGDFPKHAPVLIITDGWIEKTLRITREHAFLLPRGEHLPFVTGAPVFYYSE